MGRDTEVQIRRPSVQRVGTLISAALEVADHALLLITDGQLRWSTPPRTQTLAGTHALIVPPAGGGGTALAAVRAQQILRVAMGFPLLEQVAAALWDDEAMRAFGIEPDAPAKAPTLVPLTAEQAAHARSHLRAIDSEEGERRPGWQAMARLRLRQLLLAIHHAHLATAGADLARSTGVIRDDVRAVVDYIRANYTKRFSLAELAARCGLSPAYFSRAFSAATGVPVFTFIARVRVQKACQLLARNHLPVADIAATVGYANVSHFNRSFRRLMLTAPRDYRRSAQQ